MKDFLGPLGIIAVLVFVCTMVNPRIGLMLIIFSIILSPEFNVFDKPIRVEDILIMVVILAWVAIMATQGKNFINTPLSAPIAIYMFVSFLALMNAIVFGNMMPLSGPHRDVMYSFLTFLKKLEYFLVFFVVSNTVKTFRQVRQYVVLIFVVSAISGAYALYESAHNTSYEAMRVSAPFDPSESNTFGQYLLLHMMLIISIFFSVKNFFQRSLLAGLLLYTISAFTLTYSRGSYVALVAAIAFLGIMRERKLLFATLFCFAFASILFQQSVIERMGSGVKEVEDWYQGRADPGGNAFVHRVNSFKDGFSVAMRYPLLGAGIGVEPLSRIEAQLPREALETGFTGLFVFLWMLYSVAKLCWETIKRTKNEYVRSLSFGMLAGLVGYFVSGFSAIPFTTIRTAEPFWFLCGLVAACHQLILHGKELPEIADFEYTREKQFKFALETHTNAETR